jgi:sensor histidine kinase regulating citrate/malate metabolism
MVENGETSKSLQHIANMIEVFATKKEFARSGNINFDSILNFKLQEAQQKDILAILELNIPSNMDIPSFDMAIILGNLLDNAIKANDEIKGERYINIAIKYDKGRLIIKVQNPYEGEILKENGRFLTMKKDRANHGIGLVSIKNVLQKYNGMMEIDYSKNVFCVKILMFIDKFLED